MVPTQEVMTYRDIWRGKKERGTVILDRNLFQGQIDVCVKVTKPDVPKPTFDVNVEQ